MKFVKDKVHKNLFYFLFIIGPLQNSINFVVEHNTIYMLNA